MPERFENYMHQEGKTSRAAPRPSGKNVACFRSVVGLLSMRYSRGTTLLVRYFASAGSSIKHWPMENVQINHRIFILDS